ncbi:MAG: DUF2169 domain-containing protein [Acidiferrobacterales bacterium]
MVGKLRPQHLSASFSVKGTFRLVADEPAAGADDEPDMVSGDVHFDDDQDRSLFYPSDFVPFKPRADLLLTGACHAPGGEPVTACRVRFQVGRHAQVLYVIGDRHWRNGLASLRPPSEPQPFTRMELCYERSFGGPGYDANPVGKGMREVGLANGRTARPLPNIESPDQRVLSPDSRPEPAGFGPLAMSWAQRFSKAGTYGQDWLRERWPGFPEDFDWAFFNAAPPGLQVDGYLRGDEDLLFENLHPRHAAYRSKLPGLRARCFLNERISDDGNDETRFREVALNLDTLWVDMEAEKLILVWRGVTNVRSAKLKEIEDIFVLAEPLSEPSHDLQHFRAMMQRHIEEEDAEFEIEEREEVDVDALIEEEMAAMDRQLAQADQEFAELEAEAARLEADQRARAIEAGMDPKTFELPPTRDDDRRALMLQIAALREERPDLAAHLEEALAEADAADEEMAEMDREMAAMETEEGEPQTRESVAVGVRQGASFPESDLSNLDLSELDLSGADFSLANLREANLAGANLSGANLAGANLSGAQLTGANLTKATLDDADLSGANLAGAQLAEMSLAGSDLSELDLQGADFSGSTGEYAEFTESNLKGAMFTGAKLPRADFDGCNLEGADFRQAVLRDAEFARVQARNINMEGADITGLRSGEQADFSEASFKNVQGSGSIWDDCVLDRADYSRAMLTGASFTQASLVGTVFDRAVVTDASFDDADLRQATVSHANFLRASFERANLTEAVFEGSNLYEAGFLDAITERTNFRSANLKQTLLTLSHG